MQLLVVAVLSVLLCLYFRVLGVSWQQGQLIKAGMPQLAANSWAVVCEMGQYETLWFSMYYKSPEKVYFKNKIVPKQQGILGDYFFLKSLVFFKSKQ